MKVRSVAYEGRQMLAIAQERELQDAVALAAATLANAERQATDDRERVCRLKTVAQGEPGAARAACSSGKSGDLDEEARPKKNETRERYSRQRCQEEEEEEEEKIDLGEHSFEQFEKSSRAQSQLTETNCYAKNKEVEEENKGGDDDDEKGCTKNSRIELLVAHGQQLSRLTERSKLAPKDKAAATSGQVLKREQATAAAAAAAGVSSGKKSESDTKTSLGRETTTREPDEKLRTQRRSLLEALLGDRGKSWLEQRTVILDIQNGNKKQQAAADKKKKEKRNNNNNNKQRESDSRSDNSFGKLPPKETPSESRQASEEHPNEETTSRSLINKLPTFGSVPQRLTRLPYFTYHRSNHRLDLTPTKEQGSHPGDNHQADRYRLLSSRQKAGSLVSLGSRASSQASAAVGAVGQRLQATRGSLASSSSSPTSTSSRSGTDNLTGSRSFQASTQRRASQLGFSNISNLFPGEPNNVRLPLRHKQASLQQIIDGQADELQVQKQQRQQKVDGTRDKSASLLDLQQQRDQLTANNRRAGPQQVALSERRKSHFSALSPMTRRNSFSSALQQQQQQQQQQGQAANSRTRPHSSVGVAQLQTLQQQRQMASSRRQQLPGAGNPANASGAKFAGRGRPVSATGSYLGLAAGHHRSPSASSLHNQLHYNSSNSYRLGSAGMSPLVDPDCPVHGESPELPQPGRRRNAGSEYHESREQQHQHQQQPHYSLSQPDLLYGGARLDRDDLYDPYNTKQSGAHYPIYDSAYHQNTGGGGTTRGHQQRPTPPEYSPVSPTTTQYQHQQRYNNSSQMAGNAKYQSHGQLPPPPPQSQVPVNGGQQAYYDGSSRFSLYHPAAMSEGGAQAGVGQTRMSLAPPGEQLRRIIGYKPPSVPRPVHLHPQWAYSRPFIHLKPAGSGFGRTPTPPMPPYDPYDPDADLDQFMDGAGSGYDLDTPKFAPFNRLQDNQAVRAVDFHPSGEVYAIGSNSRALRICAYPAEHELRHFDPFDPQQQQQQQVSATSGPKAPRVLFKFLQVHRGSIYCVSFNPSGQLLATGSNDQTVHIVKYNSITHNPDGEEFRLTMHNGTIRDLCFIDDSSGNGSSLLLSAGGGDNKIYVTDCDTITPFQSMAGHTQMVMALSHCGGAQFVSGSYDKTIRFWDLRSRSCTSIVSAPPSSAGSSERSQAHLPSGPGAPVCALRVDPSGRLLASGHTDSTCMLYDIRGAKIIQTFKPHDDEIRAISFSPKSYYLLTGGYDGRLVVSDLQGDLTQPLPSACVAECQDKIVQAKWHPADFTFVSTSADKSATLWSLPGEIRN